MKIALIVGGVVLGIGAVGAIAAGVISSRQNSEEVIDSSLSTNKKESTKDSNNNKEMLEADDSSVVGMDSTIMMNLQKELDKITEANLVVEQAQNKEVTLNDVYAFNVTAKNLKVSSKANLSSSYTVEISIKKHEKDEIENLNNGALTIEVKLKDTLNNESKTKTLNLTTFKKANMVLQNIFEEANEENGNTKFSLVITPKTESESKFVSLNDLNKEEISSRNEDASQLQKQPNGLTAWLSESTLNSTTIKGVSLLGKVKLEKIAKDKSEKTYFVLKSASDSEYLKLTKTGNNDELEEVLVSQIKTTNLLATDLTVSIKQPNEEKTKALKDALEKQATEPDGFSKLESKNESGNYLSFKVPSDGMMKMPKSEVFLKVFGYENTQSAASFDLSLNLIVNFGEGSYLKTYDTSKKNDLEELKNAGISFYVYYKKLTKTNTELKPTDLITNNKLEQYFKDDNYKTPITKPTLEPSGQIPSKNNDFNVAEFSATKLSEEAIKLNLKKEDNPQNLVLFASYTYTPNTSKNELMNKVLLTPAISLINIQNKA